MKLSTRCRYATLALFDIAFHARGQATQVRQIAERQDIPVRFLEQIFQDLKRAELVDGRRGRNGGYSLRKPPEQITVGDVIRATDGPIEVSFTVDDFSPDTPSAQAGRPHREVPAALWSEIGQRIAAVFDDFTLADLVSRAEASGLSRDEPALMYFI
jgi:Rrf2 family iron-sulfur cluster assembly transcriptional regulator